MKKPAMPLEQFLTMIGAEPIGWQLKIMNLYLAGENVFLLPPRRGGLCTMTKWLKQYQEYCMSEIRWFPCEKTEKGAVFVDGQWAKLQSWCPFPPAHWRDAELPKVPEPPKPREWRISTDREGKIRSIDVEMAPGFWVHNYVDTKVEAHWYVPVREIMPVKVTQKMADAMTRASRDSADRGESFGSLTQCVAVLKAAGIHAVKA